MLKGLLKDEIFLGKNIHLKLMKILFLKIHFSFTIYTLSIRFALIHILFNSFQFIIQFLANFKYVTDLFVP